MGASPYAPRHAAATSRRSPHLPGYNRSKIQIRTWKEAAMQASIVRSARRSSVSWAIAVVAVLALPPPTHSADSGNDVPRRPDGHPDLTGTYDIATLTPVERPTQYGNQLTL